MKKYKYEIVQGVSDTLALDECGNLIMTAFGEVIVDKTGNFKKARKCFNAYKEIGDTNKEHHFYQYTELRRWDFEEKVYELLNYELWEFTGMKGKRVY